MTSNRIVKDTQQSGSLVSANTQGADRTAAKRICVLVLGAHRSGTSAITRVLSIAGARLPATLMGATTGNDLGHWESDALVQLHDRVLGGLDSAWHDWRALELNRIPAKQRGDIKDEITGILQAEYAEAPLFVVKDPRICRFAPLFLDSLDSISVVPRVILAIRNPLEVCESLERRDQMPRSDAALLWMRHVLDAEAATRIYPRAIVSYDQLLADWRVVFERLTAKTGIDWPYGIDDVTTQIDQFLSSNHRHHTRSTEQVILDPLLRDWIAETYEALLVLERNPGSDKALNDLDRIRAVFNQAAPILHRLREDVCAAWTAETRDLRAALSEAQEEREELRTRLSERDGEVSALTASSSEAESKAEQLAASLAEKDAETDELRAALSEAQVDAEENELLAALAELRGEREHLETSLTAREEEIAKYRAVHAEAETKVAELAAALSKSEETTAELKAALTSAESRAAELQAEQGRAKELQDQLAASRDELQHTKNILVHYEERVQGFENSTSWRVTAPIRWARETFVHSITKKKEVASIEQYIVLDRPQDSVACSNAKFISGEHPFDSIADSNVQANVRCLGLKKDRGTVLFVTHDTNVGGAPFVLRTLAEWFHNKTKFDVRIVSMNDGALEHEFREHVPFFKINQNENTFRQKTTVRSLHEFAGDNVQCIFINSIASAGFLRYWTEEETPIISYLHEMGEIIKHYGEAIEQIKSRSSIITVGSQRVKDVIISEFGVSPDKCKLVYDFVEDRHDTPPPDLADKLAKRSELGIPPDAYVIMGCGVLHWRKWPQKFVEAAALAVSCDPSRQWRFVWVGGGEDQKKCEALARDLGVKDIVKFLGYRPDVLEDLKAADLFFLPSQEDPFPLVCIYAAFNELPVICFHNAGGIPEFTSQGCGQAVSYGDVDAAAQAIIEYANDEEKARRHGQKGREIALGKYTVRTAGPEFLALIRDLSGVPPYVSVIVPNYNYAPYLKQRLDSIYDQTFQDIEVILLDDQSSDNSVEILSHYADQHPLSALSVNEANSGSPFAQWLKGMAEAKGELIWIAEADDYCEPDLLESLLPSMEDRNVMFGFVKSAPVGKNGEILGDYERLYLNRIHKGRWSTSYVTSDYREIVEALAIGNNIPNASAIVFRTFDPEPEFIDAVTKMRMCGDWYFYIRAIKGGLVSYVSQLLNYHRRHEGTVTHQMEGSRRYFDELRDTRRFIDSNYNLPSDICERAKEFTQQDFARFGVDDKQLAQLILAETSYQNRDKAIPSLLVVASDLSPGGGQMFAIRLANAWAKRGGRTAILNAEYSPTHADVLAKISPRVALLSRRAPHFSLEQLVSDLDIDVIHSSIWWADKLVHEHIETLSKPVPWLVSMHGCYETLLEYPDVDLSFPERFQDMKTKVSHWIYTAQKNTSVFNAMGWPANVGTIVNGYNPEKVNIRSRDDLGLRQNSLVACLASRSIETKGWFEAVDAIIELNKEGHAVDLMLIGEGPAADKLGKKSLPDFIHLHGQVSNLQDYIAACDVGLLPTYFVGESMPLVIIEMLAKGKPVIATRVGEIPTMLDNNGTPAGTLLDLVGGKVQTQDIKAALRQMMNPVIRSKLGAAAKKQFDKHFCMDSMINEYAVLYENYLMAPSMRETKSHSTEIGYRVAK